MSDARRYTTALESAFGSSTIGLRSSPWCGGRDVVHLKPTSIDCVPDVLKWASAHDVAVIPTGSCLEPRVSASGDDHPLILDLSPCRRVVEYSVEDLVLTAECGLTLEAAAQITAAHGHTIPLTPPFPARATLGGVVARGAEGMTAATYGRVRDHVLGLRIAHADGRITHCGGRVVKNVTGYDLVRLAVGSRGTLGVILEVTLRLLPTESDRCGVLAGFPTVAGAVDAAMRLRDSYPTLHAITILPRTLLPHPTEEPVALLVSLRGEPEYTAAMKQDLLRELPEGAVPCADPIPMSSPWDEVLRGGLTIAALPSRCGALLAEILTAREPGFPYVLDILSGCMRLAPPELTRFEDEERTLAPLLSRHEAYGERGGDPTFHARRARVFPEQKWDGLSLMNSIAKTLDPAGILMRGRRDF